MNPSGTAQTLCSITTWFLIFTEGDTTLQQFKLGYLKLFYYFGKKKIRLIKDCSYFTIWGKGRHVINRTNASE